MSEEKGIRTGERIYVVTIHEVFKSVGELKVYLEEHFNEAPRLIIGSAFMAFSETSMNLMKDEMKKDLPWGDEKMSEAKGIRPGERIYVVTIHEVFKDVGEVKVYLEEHFKEGPRFIIGSELIAIQTPQNSPHQGGEALIQGKFCTVSEVGDVWINPPTAPDSLKE